jgi:hypothetical protein
MSGTIVRIGATGAGALLALGLFAAPPAGASGSGRSSKAERSGKVTCFNDQGHTQGRSLSDPDGDTNGGADKPGCTRVSPWNADDDNDGNNGCGNDADREDDNNGHCGGHKKGAGNAGANGERDDETKVEAQKVDNEIEVRCQKHMHDTAPKAETNVSAAGTANDCSCPKEGNAVLGASDVKLQAAGVPAAEAAPAPAAASTTVLGSTVTAAGTGETTTTPAAPGTQVLGEQLTRPGTLARTGAGVGGLALLGGLLVGGGRLTVLARKLLRIG